MQIVGFPLRRLIFFLNTKHIYFDSKSHIPHFISRKSYHCWKSGTSLHSLSAYCGKPRSKSTIGNIAKIKMNPEIEVAIARECRFQQLHVALKLSSEWSGIQYPTALICKLQIATETFMTVLRPKMYIILLISEFYSSIKGPVIDQK